MHVQDRSELLEDSINTFYAERLVRDIIQAEDDSNAKKEAGSLKTVCTPLQVADIGDIATVSTSAASICTLAIMGESATVQIPDVRSAMDTIVVEDDFSDEYPLAIEVKAEKKEYDKEPLYRELYRIYRECSESDWDSYGANPINEQTFLEAMLLLDQLPSEMPLPEVIPEPTGNIAFEWYKGKKHVYVISISGKSTIEYAGLFGGHNKTYGAEYYSGELPELIISNILRLFS